MTFSKQLYCVRGIHILVSVMLVFSIIYPASSLADQTPEAIIAQAQIDEAVNDASGQGISSNNRLLNRIEGHFQKFPTKTMYNVRVRGWVGLDRVFEFDNTPLGNRIPVIIVPGRAEEFQPNCWWKKLAKLAEHQKGFKKDFKLYVYIYDSRLPVKAQAQHFNRDMKYLFGNLPSTQPAILITYSLGGIITTEALRDPVILDKVHTIFALAVPFHGSPMFDPEWFSTYLQPPNRSPVRKFWDRFLYRAYLFDKTNLIEGLRWDNFDGSMPQFDAKELNVHGDQLYSNTSSCIEDAFTKTMKQRTIIYASYLENGYTKSHHPMNKPRLPKYVLETSAQLPKEIVGAILPFYGLSVHSVFTYMNNQLANIPTFTPESPEGKNTHLYRFNDGIIPLSSMLWLPMRNEPYDVNLEGHIKAVDVSKVRIFVNLDHMHIGDYDGFRPSKIIVQDTVHPEDGKRKPNEWLLYDILAIKPTLKALQEGSSLIQPKEAVLEAKE